VFKGKDKYGNKYYEYDDNGLIKRRVEYSDSNSKMEIEREYWQEWLNYKEFESISDENKRMIE